MVGHRKALFSLPLFLCLFSLLVYPSFAVKKGSIVKAYQFLESLYREDIGLCVEYPESNTVWITHDNYLASIVLASWNRTVADNITSTIKNLVAEYDLPHDANGLPIDTRIEIINGYLADSLNVTELVSVNASYHGYQLKTEKATNTAIPSNEWGNYADLTLLQCLIAWRKGDNKTAFNLFERVTKMWDGIGFNDDATKTNGRYSVYKLGLFLYVHRFLGSPSCEILEQVINTIWDCQDVNGGFFTDYIKHGLYPYGVKTNCETTALILLALPQETYESMSSTAWYENPKQYVAIVGIIIFIAIVGKWVYERM